MNKNGLRKGSVETALQYAGDKWKFLIIHDLLSGTKRFGELKESVGSITQKVLTQKLRELEEDGMLLRQTYSEVPPRVEYSLTELGISFQPVIDAMMEWGNRQISETTGQNFEQLMQKDKITPAASAKNPAKKDASEEIENYLL